jgi:hypothetical protein
VSLLLLPLLGLLLLLGLLNLSLFLLLPLGLLLLLGRPSLGLLGLLARLPLPGRLGLCFALLLLLLLSGLLPLRFGLSFSSAALLLSFPLLVLPLLLLLLLLCFGLGLPLLDLLDVVGSAGRRLRSTLSLLGGRVLRGDSLLPSSAPRGSAIHAPRSRESPINQPSEH